MPASDEIVPFLFSSPVIGRKQLIAHRLASPGAKLRLPMLCCFGGFAYVDAADRRWQPFAVSEGVAW